MSGGAKNLFDRPARDPIPSCLKFPPWGGHAVETRAEPRLWVRAAWQNSSIGVGGQVLTVREQGSNRGAMAAPRAAWESVRSRTLATLEEQSRCRGGQKSVRPPRQRPHPLVPQISPVGWPRAALTGPTRFATQAISSVDKTTCRQPTSH